MAPSEGKTFRLRGIPAGFCKKDVESLVQTTLDCDDVNIRVRSLASDLDSLDEIVATVEISPVPAKFQKRVESDEWSFDTFYNDEDLSLLFDTNFLGLTPLYTPSNKQWNLDLVAVSGLGGHAFGSFKARGGGFMWLRDALPKDLPGARIIVYGTDTKLLESNSFQNLSHLGHRLRSTLHNVRAQSSDKPLILMGHSLGGVIIKEAIIQMLRGDDIDMRNRLSVYGILFFGVPNRGMSMESLVPMVGNQPNRFLLETLRAESDVLQKQTYSFLKAFPFQDSEILCCYETKRSPTAQQNNQGIWKMEGPATVFVSKDSATCLRVWETEIRNTLAMNRTHSELVKFPNKYDEEYRPIRQRLIDFALKAAEVIPKRHATVGATSCPDTSPSSLSPEERRELKNQCLRSLSFLEQDSRAHALQPAEGTCDWIFNHEDFCSWLRSSLGLFWIGGKPGSGKSMLMKRVVQRLTKDNTEAHIVASFFIYGQGVPLQKSRMGLYSTLIHQLYQPLSTAFEGLLQKFQIRTDTQGKYGEKWKWTLEDIRSHLFEALKLGSQTKSIMIFVDALDEAGEEEAQKMICDFDRLLEDLSGSNSKIRVCFSCRHYPDLRLSHAVAVSVEEHNRRDIQMVIDKQLERLTPKEQEMFKTKIVENSKGIFHWATLVVDRAIRQRKRGKPFRIVFSTFQEGQADLYQLYETLLSDLEEDDRFQAIRLFQWMLFAKKRLVLPELQHAMALSHDMPENSISEYSVGKYFTDVDDLKARIMDLSRGLVEIEDLDTNRSILNTGRPARAYFIHQSVVDYLLESGLQKLEMVQGTTISSIVGVRAHFQISRSCLRMMLMLEFEGIDQILYDDSQRRDFTTQLLTKEIFEMMIVQKETFFFHDDERLRLSQVNGHLTHGAANLAWYCWNHWIDHVLQIKKEEHLVPSSYQNCEGHVSRDETTWQDVSDQYKQCDLLDYFFWPGPDKFLKFYVRFANAFGDSERSKELQETFLKRWHVKNIAHGQLAMNVWSFSLSGSSLIHFLALSGLQAPLQRMIDNARTHLDVWDREGRTPLMYAILGSAVEITMDLIHAKVDVNTQDIYGNTALHFASFCGEERVVEALLQAGANVNLERIGGATPLHLATISQHPLIVAKILHAGADPEKTLSIKPPERDEKGWLIRLTYASLVGYHTISEELLSYGVLPGAVYCSDSSLFRHCASLRSVRAIRTFVLVGSFAPLKVQDPARRTPLSQFIECDRQGAAEILISSRATLPDHDGWTALDIAASSGNVDTARTLISNGVGFGRSLFHAALNGHAEMIDFLVRSGANVEDQDRFGRTPLFFAVAVRQIGAVLRLIEAKTPLNHADSDGKTALFYAMANGHTTKMARTLLDAGADPNWHNCMGLSPMAYAACAGELDIMKLLREFGAVRPQLSAKAQSYEYLEKFLDSIEEL